jgi:hypothetical protein
MVMPWMEAQLSSVRDMSAREDRFPSEYLLFRAFPEALQAARSISASLETTI